MTGKFSTTTLQQRFHPLQTECVANITKASILVHFQISLLVTGTEQPEPEPPPQLYYNWWYHTQFLVDLSVLMNPVSQDDAHSTTELYPLNHQITVDERDDRTRNSLYICVENSQIWCNCNFGIILRKNNCDEMCSDNNYKCVLSY